jgi:cytochrome c oxidase subunit III
MSETAAALSRFSVAEHFEDAARQAHAAKLGMAVFLATEALLFAGLFTLFAAYQTHYPAAFHEGVRHNTKVLGSINTGVLLVSSTLVACAVHMMRRGLRRVAAVLVAFTMSLGLVFLAIKFTEYAIHFREGIFPGGTGAFFHEHPAAGLPAFWTLYYAVTGLHAVHVIVGITVLGFMLVGILRGRIAPPMTYPLENGALYWHLVDVIWIFVWPLFYLA